MKAPQPHDGEEWMRWDGQSSRPGAYYGAHEMSTNAFYRFWAGLDSTKMGRDIDIEVGGTGEEPGSRREETDRIHRQSQPNENAKWRVKY